MNSIRGNLLPNIKFQDAGLGSFTKTESIRLIFNGTKLTNEFLFISLKGGNIHFEIIFYKLTFFEYRLSS